MNRICLTLLIMLLGSTTAVAQIKSVVLVRTEANSAGTGVLIDQSYVLTANHVVQGNARVRVESGSEIVSASVVARDVLNDLAILSLSVPINNPLLHLSDEALQLADNVRMLGHANAKWTVTERPGQVVGIQRKNNEVAYIRITTPVIHGMSGGPVLNEQGKVAGIIVAVVIEESKPVSTLAAPFHAIISITSSFLTGVNQ